MDKVFRARVAERTLQRGREPARHAALYMARGELSEAQALGLVVVLSFGIWALMWGCVLLVRLALA